MDREKPNKAKCTESTSLSQTEVPTKSLSARAHQERGDLRPFFSMSPDFICTVGFDGHFKRLNPIWTSRLGWDADKLKNKHFLDFVHPDDHVATRNEFDKLINDQETTFFENRYRHQNGDYHWLRWSMWSTPDRQWAYAIAQDITRNKRQEQEILEIADREKERLGLELHDSLCQSLAGIAALSLTLSKRLATHSDTTAATSAVEIKNLLNETIRQARDIAHDLSPIGINTIGLQGSIETLAFNTQQWHNTPCILTLEHTFPRLHHEIEKHLFRIAQEAVCNAVKHGKSDQIKISLSAKNNEGFLNIRDNGLGILDKLGDTDGIGLHTMHYRARLIGGRLDIQQLSQCGIAVICIFPLTNHEI